MIKIYKMLPFFYKLIMKITKSKKLIYIKSFYNFILILDEKAQVLLKLRMLIYIDILK